MDIQRLRNFTQSQFEDDPEEVEIKRKNQHNIIDERNENTHLPKHPDRRFSILSPQSLSEDLYPMNEEKIHILENMKIQKQKKQKDFEELVYQQTPILEEYVAAFVEALGRKPLSSEIMLNMKDNIDTYVIDQYLQTYNSDETSMV
jgi:hypothetical protein